MKHNPLKIRIPWWTVEASFLKREYASNYVEKLFKRRLPAEKIISLLKILVAKFGKEEIVAIFTNNDKSMIKWLVSHERLDILRGLGFLETDLYSFACKENPNALFLACRTKNYELAQYLLTPKVRVNVHEKNEAQQSVWDIANESIVNLGKRLGFYYYNKL